MKPLTMQQAADAVLSALDRPMSLRQIQHLARRHDIGYILPGPGFGRRLFSPADVEKLAQLARDSQARGPGRYPKKDE